MTDVTCNSFRPDHNGECLNCDEPYSEHHCPGCGRVIPDVEYNAIVGLTQALAASKRGLRWMSAAFLLLALSFIALAAAVALKR
jgi:hypothetical protein